MKTAPWAAKLVYVVRVTRLESDRLVYGARHIPEPPNRNRIVRGKGRWEPADVMIPPTHLGLSDPLAGCPIVGHAAITRGVPGANAFVLAIVFLGYNAKVLASVVHFVAIPMVYGITSPWNPAGYASDYEAMQLNDSVAIPGHNVALGVNTPPSHKNEIMIFGAILDARWDAALFLRRVPANESLWLTLNPAKRLVRALR
jgi:hypothetical protein